MWLCGELVPALLPDVECVIGWGPGPDPLRSAPYFMTTAEDVANFTAGPLAVNSRHHQGIKGLAPALHAQAVASDGLIEAVYLPEYRFVQAVQWHPEHRWQAAESQSLLRSFVGACRG